MTHASQTNTGWEVAHHPSGPEVASSASEAGWLDCYPRTDGAPLSAAQVSAVLAVAAEYSDRPGFAVIVNDRQVTIRFAASPLTPAAVAALAATLAQIV